MKRSESGSFDIKSAGLLYGSSPHHIDHLAPLCALLGIPLIVTEEEIASLCRTFYPDLNVLYIHYLELPETVVSTFDLLFYSIPRALFDEVFFFAEQFLRKTLITIWCPHGNSDKGLNCFFMEALREEKFALLYGKKMVDFMKEKQAFEQLEAHVLTGNFRFLYYQKHQSFYDTCLAKKLKKFPQSSKDTKLLLFAPTWQDKEGSSAFFDASSILLHQLPQNYHLIVKLHPNLFLQKEEETLRLIEAFENHPRVLVLKDFPPIYPLLQRVDIYLGDASSIGYDALTFQKPLFFLNQTGDIRPLHSCGTSIPKECYPRIYEILQEVLPEDGNRFSALRKEMYALTFGSFKSLETLKKEISSMCKMVLHAPLSH